MSGMPVMRRGGANGICCKANTQLIKSKKDSLKKVLICYYQLDGKPWHVIL